VNTLDYSAPKKGTTGRWWLIYLIFVPIVCASYWVFAVFVLADVFDAITLPSWLENQVTAYIVEFPMVTLFVKSNGTGGNVFTLIALNGIVWGFAIAGLIHALWSFLGRLGRLA
jgi:hypothetical protein